MNTPTGIYTSNVYHSSIPMGDKMMVEELDYFIPAEDNHVAKKRVSKKKHSRRKKALQGRNTQPINHVRRLKQGGSISRKTIKRRSVRRGGSIRRR